MELSVGDVVLCTVDRIIGTTVFVNIESQKEKIEGTIITSEIAPGRIRNLRDYVVPKKKIVCKILRISENRIDLSLRRVTLKERKEVLEQYSLENSYEKIIKNILGDKSQEKINEMTKEERLYDFIENAKKNMNFLKKIVGNADAEKIMLIINEQKGKKIELKKELSVNISSPNGLELIKKMFGNPEEIEIKYISAGKYSLRIISEDFKKANIKMKEYIEKLEKFARENNLNFAIKEK